MTATSSVGGTLLCLTAPQDVAYHAATSYNNFGDSGMRRAISSLMSEKMGFGPAMTEEYASVLVECAG